MNLTSKTKYSLIYAHIHSLDTYEQMALFARNRYSYPKGEATKEILKEMRSLYPRSFILLSFSPTAYDPIYIKNLAIASIDAYSVSPQVNKGKNK